MARPAPRPCSAGAGRGPPTSSRSGRSTSRPSTAGPAPVGDVQFETDRARFLGRGRTPGRPGRAGPGRGALGDDRRRCSTRSSASAGGSGSSRAASAVVAFTTAVADSREEALALADQYREPQRRRPGPSSWPGPTARSSTGTANWSPEDAHLFQRLASHLIFAGPALRADPAVLAANRQGQPGLWRLRHLGRPADRPGPDRRRPTSCPWPGSSSSPTPTSGSRGWSSTSSCSTRSRPSVPRRAARAACSSWSGRATRDDLVDQPGGVFVREADAARPRTTDPAPGGGPGRPRSATAGPLAGQLDRIERRPAAARRRWLPRAPGPLARRRAGRAAAPTCCSPTASAASRPTAASTACSSEPRPPPTSGRNGKPGRRAGPTPILPPAPWINVVANPAFGFLVSEAGSGFTWAGNSQTNRLTPWSNDPVSDPPGEVVYLRDEETGEVWSPTPLPVPSAAPTLVRHGQGYTVFEREHARPRPRADPVRPARRPGQADPPAGHATRATGRGGSRRRSTPSGCWGRPATPAAMHVVTEVDPETGALLARNAFRRRLRRPVAFVDVDRRPRTVTATATEFLGRHGSVAAPGGAGPGRALGPASAPALDPCAAIQAKFDARPRRGDRGRLPARRGRRPSTRPATWSRRYREPGRGPEAARRGQGRAGTTSSAPSRCRRPTRRSTCSLNRWLLYQVLSCRVWGRSAFYQSGGAYGFRDQLQDVMALVYAAPDEARAQILRAAARQFVEGDVQHWWHPPAGRGVRTRISDDLLWLPFVVCHYVDDDRRRRVLDEQVPFLEGPAAASPDRRTTTACPAVVERVGHALRALRPGARARACGSGAHGLPLMGTGDWNDGMNRVGAEGKGESVWLAWFLLAALRRFAELAEARGDAAGPARCRERAEAAPRGRRGARLGRRLVSPRLLRRRHAARLGAGTTSARSTRSPRSWAVISGAADPERAAGRWQSVDERLVRPRRRADPAVRPRRSTTGRSSPATSRATCRASARTAASTPTRPPGSCWPPRCSGRGRRAVELFDLLNPIRHADRPRGGRALQGRALRRRGRRLRPAAAHRPRRLDLVHRLGRLALPRRPRGDPRLPKRRRPPGHRPVHPAGLAGLRDHLPLPVHDLPDRRREPGASGARGRRSLARRPASRRARISLVDDRQAHEVRVVIGSS